MKRLTALFNGQKNGSPLMEPYTPSRLEWLALDLESSYKTELSGDDISLDFTAIAPDTILVSVMYTNDTSAGVVDAIIEQSKELAQTDAQSHGWAKWIKIRVEKRNLSTGQR